jgi:hypothetical protein
MAYNRTIYEHLHLYRLSGSIYEKLCPVERYFSQSLDEIYDVSKGLRMRKASRRAALSMPLCSCSSHSPRLPLRKLAERPCHAVPQPLRFRAHHVILQLLPPFLHLSSILLLPSEGSARCSLNPLCWTYLIICIPRSKAPVRPLDTLISCYAGLTKTPKRIV